MSAAEFVLIAALSGIGLAVALLVGGSYLLAGMVAGMIRRAMSEL